MVMDFDVCSLGDEIMKIYDHGRGVFGGIEEEETGLKVCLGNNQPRLGSLYSLTDKKGGNKLNRTRSSSQRRGSEKLLLLS